MILYFDELLERLLRYLTLIYKAAQYSPECNIMALIYINRMASLHQLPLTMSNWRSVWLISVLLAHKFFDDKSLHLRGFVRFCPIFTLSELKMLERSALTLLSYSVAVKPSLYVKYYFELRQLFSEISGPSSGIWTLEALTLCQSRKLETRSLLAEKSAQTYEDATRTDRTPYLIRPCP